LTARIHPTGDDDSNRSIISSPTKHAANCWADSAFPWEYCEAYYSALMSMSDNGTTSSLSSVRFPSVAEKKRTSITRSHEEEDMDSVSSQQSCHP